MRTKSLYMMAAFLFSATTIGGIAQPNPGGATSTGVVQHVGANDTVFVGTDFYLGSNVPPEGTLILGDFKGWVNGGNGRIDAICDPASTGCIRLIR